MIVLLLCHKNLLLTFLFSAKPSIAIGNLNNLIQYGLYDDHQLFIYTCKILKEIAVKDFNR